MSAPETELALLTLLQVKYPTATRSREFDREVVTLPAVHAGFGPLAVSVEPGSGYCVSLGRFTHTHFDHHGDASEVGAGADVLRFLDEVLADRVVCYSTIIFSGGGHFRRDDGGCRVARALARELWVWSGPLAP